MAIVQDEISLVKVKNGVDGGDGKDGTNGKDGENGKDSNTYTAYSWSADGSDRFTDKYPNENLVLRQNFLTTYAPYNSVPKVDELGKLETVVINANMYGIITIGVPKNTLMDGAYTVSGVFKINGKPLKLEQMQYGLRANTYNLKGTGELKGDGSFLIREWYANLNWILHFAITDLKKGDVVTIDKFKFELTTPQIHSTIYTPSPKDDFNNAWPTFIGTYSSHNKVQSQNPKDYTWARIRGTDGSDGKDGQTPKDVISGYLSNEAIIVPATPTGAVTDYSKAFGDFFVFEGQDKKSSDVTYSKVSEVDMTSTINSAGRYVVTALSADTGTATYRATYAGVTVDKILIVVKNKQGPSGANGAKGDKGDSGKDGIAGKDGVGVKSTTIVYGISDSESTQPTTWTSSVPSLVKGKYLWTKTVWEYTDNTNETGYVKTYIAKDGNNGNDGIAGKDGVGIKNTTFKYGVSTSGTTKPSNWSTTIPVVPEGQFLWTETTWTYTDNTSEKGYSVAKQGAKGPQGDKGATGKDGIAGKDGVGLKETIIRYASSTSGGVAPTNGWQSTVPTVAPGDFLWTRTTWAYTDNTSEDGYSVSRIGEDGNTGKDGIAGKDGVGIEDTTITYVGSTNGTTPPSTGWTSTIPTVVDGSYLWTKTVWLYTDKTSETGYSVAKMGVQGEKGDKGATGEKGLQGDPTGITVSPTVPTNPYINMLWQNIGSNNGYLTGTVYQWNGAKWNIFIFSAENIVANSLSAISAYLGNVQGGTIAGSEFINKGEFYNPAIDKLCLFETVINGHISTNYSEKNGSGKGVFYLSPYQLGGGYSKKGNLEKTDTSWSFGDNGLWLEQGSQTAGNWSYVLVARDRIEMFEERFNNGTGDFNLKISDIAKYPPTQLDPASGYSIYSVSGENLPTAKRSGRTVTLSGAFKNNRNVSTDETEIILGRLPKWAVPKDLERTVCQGSGVNRFLLTIRPNGNIYWSRYGNSTYETAGAGAWLTINIRYDGVDL